MTPPLTPQVDATPDATIIKELKNNKELEKGNNSSNEELQHLAAEAFGIVDGEHVQKQTETLTEPVQTTPPSQALSLSQPIEGEVVDTGKPKKLVKPKREPNPDGSYGDPEVNEVRSYFLQAQQISSEDCTRQESAFNWSNLLKWIEKEVPNLNRVEALKKFIDYLVSGMFIDPSFVTSGKKLYYRRNELMKKIRERKTRHTTPKTVSKVTYGNIVGGVAW